MSRIKEVNFIIISIKGNIRLRTIFTTRNISDFDDNYLPHKNERGCIWTNHVYGKGEVRRI